MKDDSIIIISPQPYIIPEKEASAKVKDKPIVPAWPQRYIYSRSDLRYASREQQEFYAYFKSSFFEKTLIDLEGNFNYAFVLLHDIFHCYKRNKNIRLLEERLKDLGTLCPKTIRYGLEYLRRKKERAGDVYGVMEILLCEFTYSAKEQLSRRPGAQYGELLVLNETETALVNRIGFYENTFIAEPGCCCAVIRLYLALLNALEQAYQQKGSSRDKELATLADLITQQHFKYRPRHPDYYNSLRASIVSLHTIIFKHCENAVRGRYHYKQKISTARSYTPAMVNQVIEARLVANINMLLPDLVDQIAEPDAATQVFLNSRNMHRWKTQFAQINAAYGQDADRFYAEVVLLGVINEKNPSVENIFFEAAKCMSNTDVATSMKLYMHYLFHALKSGKDDDKRLTKAIQKSLAMDKQQLLDFENTVNDLLEDRDLNKAIERIPGICNTKRRKIELSNSAIREVQLQHSDTVVLLNGYLQDDPADCAATMMNPDRDSDRIGIAGHDIAVVQVSSPHISSLALEPLHLSTLDLFVEHNFSLPATELAGFARANNVFPGQLIVRINEVCFEHLDDVLIEEDADCFIINEQYYQRILKYDK